MMWQPIATAPKDGSEFLAGYTQDGYVVGIQFLRWNRARQLWTSEGSWVPFMTATHWMPNPPITEHVPIAQLLQVGHFTITRTPGKLHIRCGEGEGGEFAEADLEAVLAAFWDEKF